MSADKILATYDMRLTGLPNDNSVKDAQGKARPPQISLAYGTNVIKMTMYTNVDGDKAKTTITISLTPYELQGLVELIKNVARDAEYTQKVSGDPDCRALCLNRHDHIYTPQRSATPVDKERIVVGRTKGGAVFISLGSKASPQMICEFLPPRNLRFTTPNGTVVGNVHTSELWAVATARTIEKIAFDCYGNLGLSNEEVKANKEANRANGGNGNRGGYNGNRGGYNGGSNGGGYSGGGRPAPQAAATEFDDDISF